MVVMVKFPTSVWLHIICDHHLCLKFPSNELRAVTYVTCPSVPPSCVITYISSTGTCLKSV